MLVKEIDINCDVGEGMLGENQLFSYISSCNIACGGHYGNDVSMQRTIVLAKENTVKIGAHPSYPDKENFGRKSISISDNDLMQSITSQLLNFELILRKMSTKLHHIKPHGALYNDLVSNGNLAEVYLKAIDKYKSTSYLYVPYASVISKLAIKQGFKIKHEVFVDRSYNKNHSLVSRKFPNAVLESEEEVLIHTLRMVKENKIVTVSGLELEVQADTFCLHGDNPKALKILQFLNKELPKHNIIIQR